MSTTVCGSMAYVVFLTLKGLSCLNLLSLFGSATRWKHNVQCILLPYAVVKVNMLEKVLPIYLHIRQTRSNISIHLQFCFWPPEEFNQYSVSFISVLFHQLLLNIWLVTLRCVHQLVSNFYLFVLGGEVKDRESRLVIILCGFAPISNSFHVLHSYYIHDQY